MIRVLHLFTTLDGGGVESFLYNYYSNMDTSKIIFDTVVPGEKIGYLEAKFIDLGGEVFHICRFRENPIKHIREVSNIIKNGHYDIVHCHGYKSTIGLLFAKIWGCKVRIIHSHMAYVNESWLKKSCRNVITLIAKLLATEKFACGIDAAKWLFGVKDYEKGNVRIINNAIDLSKYSFDEKQRENYREKLGLIGKFVIGNVARLTYQKNQSFLLRVFKEILLRDESAILLLVGEGEDREKLEKECIELGMDKKVKFLGMRKDISELLSTMDVFVLPSRYEGLPVVLAEVQASGLLSCVSSNVTREINETNSIYYLSLESSYELWCKKIIEITQNNNVKKRVEKQAIMHNGKYDIKYQAKKLFDTYISLINNENLISRS